MGFNKCEFEPNIQCDMEYNCLDCLKQENLWAETWINGAEEAEAEREADKIIPVTVQR